MLRKSKLITLLLLSIPALLFSMEKPAKRKRKKSTASKNYHATPVRELKKVYAAAPPKAKNAVEQMKDPRTLGRNRSNRATFLLGIPGLGKKKLAKAMVYMSEKVLKHIPCIDRSPSEIGDRIDKIREMLGKKEKAVVIISDMDKLQKETDRHPASSVVDQIFNNLRIYKHLFFIGTINSGNITMPQETMLRILPLCVPLVAPDPAMRIKIFRSKVIDKRTTLDPECDESFLDSRFREYGGNDITGRDLQYLAYSVREVCCREKQSREKQNEVCYREEQGREEKKRIILKSHFETVIAERRKLMQTFYSTQPTV